MSFILDALKKSESERQPQSAAEFTAIPSSPAVRTLPKWLWIVGLLLLINASVMIGLFLQSEQRAALLVTEPDSNKTMGRPEESNDDFVDQVERAKRNPPSAQSTTAAGTSAAKLPPRDANVDTVRPVLISQAPETVNLDKQYATIHEMQAGGAINLPALHLDIHVFSDLPADRFVFINMNKHREGSALTEGPLVTEITPQGVVLSHDGHTFLLPRE